MCRAPTTRANASDTETPSAFATSDYVALEARPPAQPLSTARTKRSTRRSQQQEARPQPRTRSSIDTFDDDDDDERKEVEMHYHAADDDDADDDYEDDWLSARSGFSVCSFAESVELRKRGDPERQVGTGEEDDNNKGEDEDREEEEDIAVLAEAAWARSLSTLKDAGAADDTSLQPLVSPRSSSLAAAQPSAEELRQVKLRTRSQPPSASSENDAQIRAWRMLEEATGHLEEDALDRLEEGGDGVRARPGGGGGGKGVFARLARVGKGMRMMQSLSKAMYASGGSLDLTSFAGTPIRWHTPHSVLQMHAMAVSPLKAVMTAAANDDGGEGQRRASNDNNGANGRRGKRKSRAFRLFIQTQRDFGALRRKKCQTERRLLPSVSQLHTQSSQMPHNVFDNPLYFAAAEEEHNADAWDNVSVNFEGVSSGDDELCLESSQRASVVAYDDGDGIAGESAAVAFGRPVLPPVWTSEGRILRVVRCLLADAEPPASLQKPFNAVLGETARHDITLSDGTEVRSVVEQVSHHPPVTAFHSAGDGWAIYGHFQPRPKLVGMHVEVEIFGKRFFRLPIQAAPPGIHNRSGSTTAAEIDRCQGEGAAAVSKDEDTRHEMRSDEVYESTFVGFEWHFMPRMYTQMSTIEPWTVRCDATGLAAEVKHVERRLTEGASGGFRVIGRVYRFKEPGQSQVPYDDHDSYLHVDLKKKKSNDKEKRFSGSSSKLKSKTKGEGESAGKTLFTITGRYDTRVMITDVRTGETALLYDAGEAANAEEVGVDRSVMFYLPEDEKATERVWGDTVRAMNAKKWEEARAGKRAVEQAERLERRRREREGERWIPKLFEWDDLPATWVLKEGLRRQEFLGASASA